MQILIGYWPQQTMTRKKHKIAVGDNQKWQSTSSSLNERDRLLWHRVTVSVQPFSPKKQLRAGSGSDNPVTGEGALPVLMTATAIIPSSSQSARRLPHKSSLLCKNVPAVKNNLPASSILQGLNRKAQRKVSRQHFDHTIRLDLHGLDQDAAYSRLLHFIRSNAGRDQSLILVITGKGRSSGSTGILRQLVPQWLTTPPFRSYVNAVETAARHHGGEGAFYVRLRKTSRE